ncbi:3-deoxy-7-phosphoheptulonate synthase [Chromatiales bacterium (ex Bugula neritina AB1)]|nr:3-deoxy-7-phosphoheptulonate synthase [Chromatiales bacterium (ex Bugula neritina AB1)]
MTTKLSNVNIVSESVLITPRALRNELPRSPYATATVNAGRDTVEAILDRRDPRLLVVAGPCSIHDIDAAKDYARRLKEIHDKHSDSLFIVMRVYFEKPRTTVGWKGFINDPDLNDSFDIDKGLHKARELLIWLAELGLPAGTEALDPISPQYLSDLFSWTAIGARTSESQTHREMSSGLSTPVGFKNGTDGSLDIAINAMKSASSPHRFLGINNDGQVTRLETRGNAYGHVILRGGSEPNYDSVSVAIAEQALVKANLAENLVVDCSHANSHKNFELQPLVADNVCKQIAEGNRSIIGIMLESHLSSGNQKLGDNPDSLTYGVSITDECIDWETTETLMSSMADQIREPLRQRVSS